MNEVNSEKYKRKNYEDKFKKHEQIQAKKPYFLAVPGLCVTVKGLLADRSIVVALSFSEAPILLAAISFSFFLV